MSSRFSYSAWDGTQIGFDLDSLSLIDQMADDLMYHGDVQAALRRLMQDGMVDTEGNRLEGLREMMERLRSLRSEALAKSDLGSITEGLRERLDQIIDAERSYMDRQELAALDSGDPEWLDQAVDAFSPKRTQLDLLPPDLAGQIKDLNNYKFANRDAQAEFDELIDELREQIVGRTFNQISGAMQNISPEELARMKDMMAALNEMLDERANGREPDFGGFMERFGDMFPERPTSLDELLEVMAQRMAAMQALLNSMSPEQRAELAALSEALMEDMDLRWQMEQLSSSLQSMFPDVGWSQRYSGEGSDPIGLGDALRQMDQLGEIDRLEQLMRSASAPGALAEVDLDAVRRLLGEDSARSIDELAALQRRLEAEGMVHRTDGRFELSPQGLRALGSNALRHVFKRLDASKIGGHERASEGIGHERSFATKPYEYGDPFNLHIERTLRNAIVRGGSALDQPGIRLSAEDFEIEMTEQTVRCATVVMLDLSLSMHMRHYFTSAKQTALALHSLISSKFPKDYLGLVGFGESAHVLSARELPSVSWDLAYGTNMQHGLMLARQLLSRQRGNKQVLMITDGEPTAHQHPGTGQPVFQYPPSRETLELTMAEVLRCTRASIRINTFMLEPDQSLQRFISQVSDVNQGRAFYATPGNLGDFVLVDFLEQRQSLVRGRRSA